MPLCACYAMKPGIVYFLQAATGQVKIGFTRNLIDRFSTLQVGNHEQLTVLAAHFGERAEESDLHARFHRFLIHGEWFHPDPEIIAHISTLTNDIANSFNAANTGRCAECPSWHRTILEIEPGVFTSLCQRCLMSRDGRLGKFVAFASKPKPKKQKVNCTNCKRLAKPTRRGRCGMCNEHLRRHGVERPIDLPIRERKTACKRGHIYTPETTLTDKNGHHACRLCANENYRIRAAASRASASGVSRS